MSEWKLVCLVAVPFFGVEELRNRKIMKSHLSAQFFAIEGIGAILDLRFVMSSFFQFLLKNNKNN